MELHSLIIPGRRIPKKESSTVRYKYTDPATRERRYLELQKMPDGSIVRVPYLPDHTVLEGIKSGSALGTIIDSYKYTFKVKGDMLYQVQNQ